MIEPIHVPTWGDPDQYLDDKGQLVRADGTLVFAKRISDEEREAFAEEFAKNGDRVMILPDSVSYRNVEQTRSGFDQGLANVYDNLNDHKGRCGPRWRPLRAWFGVTAWKFKGCRTDFGFGGFCERRYVWDRGQWRRLLSERQLTQLEREVLWK